MVLVRLGNKEKGDHKIQFLFFDSVKNQNIKLEDNNKTTETHKTKYLQVKLMNRISEVQA